MVGSSAAPFPSSGSSRFSVHVSPASIQVITTAASLHLGNFLRRRIHQGFLLPSASSNLQHISYLGHLPCLRDVWNEGASSYMGFNMLQWSYDAISCTCMSFYFLSGEGNKNDSSHSEKAFSQSFFNQRSWTKTMIAVNAAVFIAQIATRGKLLSWGAKINSLIDKGQLWRLVTSSFLHANVVHLMVNCYSLSCIGPAVENFSGSRRYLAVYFTSAIASSAMSYWLCKSSSVGASGAIFGIIGSYAVFLLRHKEIIVDGDQRLKDILRVLAMNVGIGICFKGIDNWGHLGGFLGGAATSWLLGPAFKIEHISSEGKKYLTDRPPISTLFKHSRSPE